MKLRTLAVSAVAAGALGLACGSRGAGHGDSSPQSPNSGNSGDGSAGEGGAPSFGGTDPGGEGIGASGGGEACASQTVRADLEPVYLAFAFDVSGSMGAADEPWHDRSLKWDPVVKATKQFFNDTLSRGISASLTFFPSDHEDNDLKCMAESYTTPDVPMTPLPSTIFADALDEMTEESEREWRGGTPTPFVMRGTISLIEALRQATPGRYAIVLVTDGYPQGCGERNNRISRVVDEATAALAKGIPTYVIGVANPPFPDAPETVADMDQVAVAGGTEHAYLIDTGNPESTTAAFKAAVDAIRGASVSCIVEISPAPDGRSFDAQKVRVTYQSGNGEPTALTYDQECAAQSAWRYDSPEDPTQIVLCESTCAAIQADPEAALGVDFTCEDVIIIPR